MALIKPKIPSSLNRTGIYQIQRMLPRHFKMVELHCAGLTNRQIAKIIDCSHQSVAMVLKSPIVRKEIQRRMVDSSNGSIQQSIEAFETKTIRILEDHCEKAALTQVELLESDDDSIKLRSSNSILDRVLGRPDSKNASEASQIKIEIDAKDAQVIMIALKESKEISNGQNAKPATDRQDADSSENGQGNVHQTPLSCSGLGYRKAKTQAAASGRKVVTNTNTNTSLSLSLSLAQSDGGKDTPPTK